MSTSIAPAAGLQTVRCTVCGPVVYVNLCTTPILWAYLVSPRAFRLAWIMAGTATCSRPGYLSFRKHLKELESAVTDPGGLAVELYSDGLIDKVTLQKASLASVTQLERSRELLLKLEDKIKSQEDAFEKFLSILVRYPTFEDICTKLRGTRGNLLLLVWRTHTS